MLRRRSTTVQNQSKCHMMPDSTSDSCFFSDAATQKAKGTSFFCVPGLFVGFSTKGSSDSDSSRSPTSPLEFKALFNLSNSFVRSPRSPGFDGHPRVWDCCKVGLGLVDSLNDETKPCGKVERFSESKNILLGSQMRINIPITKSHFDSAKDDPLGAATKSLPKDYGITSTTHRGSPCCYLGCSKMGLGSSKAESEFSELGKIRSCSADIGRSSMPLSRIMYNNLRSNSEVFSPDPKNSNLEMESPALVGDKNFGNFGGSSPISINSSTGFVGSLSASEIEMSEDYTCIISHGPNPRTTRIFGDCILESYTTESAEYSDKNGEEVCSPWLINCSDDSLRHPSDDFLSFCLSCKKKLEQGKDIYIYRGEKAFCSSDCRDKEILTEEEMEKATAHSARSPGSSFHEEIFLAGMLVAA